MESLFEPFDPTYRYGGYFPSGSTEIAYRAVMIDRAIRGDKVALLENAIELGWLTPECRAFDNSHVALTSLGFVAKPCEAYGTLKRMELAERKTNA